MTTGTRTPAEVSEAALDGDRLSLAAATSAHGQWDLWYADNAGGAWSRPARITR